MENKKPEFAFKDQSVIALVTELHTYFRDLQSYYQIFKGELLSQLDKVTDSAQNADLQQQLAQINKKIEYFHILNNSISSADVVLHTPEMIAEFKPTADGNDA